MATLELNFLVEDKTGQLTQILAHIPGTDDVASI